MRLLLLMLLMLFVTTATAASRCPLHLAASTTTFSPLDVHFSLKYTGKNPVEIWQRALPWASHGSINMQVFEGSRSGKKIEELGYIADPGPDKVTLMPGQAYNGIIHLGARYRDIETAHEQHDLIVVWSYTLTPINGAALPTVSGSLVIKK